MQNDVSFLQEFISTKNSYADGSEKSIHIYSFPTITIDTLFIAMLLATSKRKITGMIIEIRFMNKTI